MIRNYLKVAFRNLLRQRVYSVINILGLAIGIASCVLISLYVVDELSYDTFHTNGDRLYKVTLERKYPTYSINYAVIPYSFGDVIQADFPEVQSVVKMGGPFGNNTVTYRNNAGEEKYFEENFIMAADSNFFRVFNLRILKGDPASALDETFDIVLTEETARRYFSDEEPVGKHLSIFNRDYVVSAVCENVPENSHMKFDFLFNYDVDFLHNGRPNFLGFSTRIYLELKPGADPQLLEAKFPDMVEKYAAEQFGNSWAEYRKAGNDYRYFLQNVKDIHLDPSFIEGSIKPGGNRNYVYFLGCIAVLILVIACINFMNLAISRSVERAREVGVRKTMGSVKWQLVSQFLLESLLITTCATLLAVIIIYSALPYFDQATGKSVGITLNLRLVIVLIGITLLTGLLAGAYPAFILSSFNPVSVMKGAFTGNTKGSSLRNGLVAFQFIVSIALIASTLVISRQMHFMQDKSLGYKRDQFIVVERLFALEQNQTQTFLDELERLPYVEAAAGSFIVPGGNRLGDVFGEQWTTEGSTERLTTKSIVIDDRFADVMGLELVAGRNFSTDTNDSLAVIFNETAVRTFGITDPVGQTLRSDDGVELRIIGVFRDFNFESLHNPITPLTVRSSESFQGGATYAFARIKNEDLAAAVSGIADVWNGMAPGQPFRYMFFDENLKAQYENEKRAGQTFSMFAVLAIVIACVGLFGLASYTASRRTKEIGIRKVLGASTGSIVFLLSMDFAKLIALSFVIATPLAWYVMDNWLSNFAYRISLGAGVFIIAGLITLVIGWLTVSYQSIKAGIADPVKSLRSE